jgi:hypothetical protein
MISSPLIVVSFYHLFTIVATAKPFPKIVIPAAAGIQVPVSERSEPYGHL